MSESPKNWRRWFRFRLRTLLLAWIVIAIWLGWWISSARQQRNAVANIQKLTDQVFIDYDFQRINNDPLSWRPRGDPNASSWVPSFALSRLGVDCFHNVVAVNVLYGHSGNEIALADKLARLPNLEQLVLVYVDGTDEMVAHLVACRGLTGLELRGSLGDGSLRLISTLPKLQLLDTRGDFTDDGLAHLRRCQTLKSLQLTISAISDAGLSHLAELRNLERLDIKPVPNATGWYDLGFTADGIAHLGQLRNLKYLQLYGGRVTTAAIAKLAACKNLRELSLRQCRFSDDGLQGFAALTELESLDLLCAHFKGAGFEPLSRLTNLKHLNLTFSSVTDEAIRYLAALPRLKEIDLRDTYVTAAGLEKFKDSPSLRRIAVSEQSNAIFSLIFGSFGKSSGLSASDLKRVRQELPNCKINQ